MRKTVISVVSLIVATITSIAYAGEDPRQLVKFPEMMQEHMLGNMRDHLQTLNQILIDMGQGKLDKASELAEARLGMSSLELHGASHMAKFMPKGMQEAGTAMHKAASRFARKAEEGDLIPAYKALADVTSSCVACHSAYRIR
jgi:hypothetical protein